MLIIAEVDSDNLSFYHLILILTLFLLADGECFLSGQMASWYWGAAWASKVWVYGFALRYKEINE